MARQSQDNTTESKLLRQQLCRYLLVVDGSPFGSELVDAVVWAYRARHLGRVIRLEGDKYFGNLIEDLLSKWSIQVSRVDEPEPSHHVIYVPNPAERKEDLPTVIAQMVQELTQSFDKHNFDTPEHICGNSIKFLLGFPHWSDFDNIRKFLELALAEEWKSDKGTVELRKALVFFRDNLKEHTPAVYDEPQTPKMQEWLGDPEPVRVRVVSDLRHYHWFDNMLDPAENDFEFDLVSSYLFANSSQPHSIAHRFPLDAVGQVMHNVHALWRRLPGRPLLDEASDRAVVQVIRIRAQQFRNSLKARTEKRGEGLDQEMRDKLESLHPGNIWHEWDEKAETQALVDAGLCSPDGYHDLMAECHFGLTFPHVYTTYEDRKDAKEFLFSHGKAPTECRKPGEGTKTLKIMEDDSTVVYGEEKYGLPDKFYKAVCHLANQHLDGNPSVEKHRIYQVCDVTQAWIQGISVKKWFRQHGGEAQRFAEDGLIESLPNGNCRLAVPTESIQIVPARDDDSSKKT